MQLVAYGAQDVYLTGNPQITFFKVVYRRHTNFATESIEQTFSGTGNFGRKVTCDIQRAGDLITKMYLRVALPALVGVDGSKVAWCSQVGHALIDSFELTIGGTSIDKVYGDWLNVWHELARNYAQDRGYNVMIGNTPELTTLAPTQSPATLWIPIPFAFCRNDGLALPVIALQYHDIRFNIEFNAASSLICYTGSGVANVNQLQFEGVSLYVDYVYLDNEERKRFAQASHEYLFEQLQYTGDESVNTTNTKYRLNLNHPCKELIWVARHTDYTSGSQFLAYDTNDWEACRVLATKRFALRCAVYASSGVLTLSNGALTRTNLGAAVNAIFDEIAVASTSTSAQTEFLVVTGRLLTVVEMSKMVSTLVDLGMPADCNGGDGEAVNDVTVWQWDNYGINLDKSVNPTAQALLQLNGHDRFSVREGEYFNFVQPYQCHSNTPSDGVNVYSFALNPEEHQPSGTCNFSRIDNATLNVQFDPTYASTSSGANISIYATNYNVLRIMSGMGGLAYSN